jgi:hypothetical protein
MMAMSVPDTWSGLSEGVACEVVNRIRKVEGRDAKIGTCIGTCVQATRWRLEAEQHC